MMIGRIEEIAGTVVYVLGKSQGYFGLPVRYESMWDNASQRHVMTMTTAWFPDPAELAAINAGESIHLRLFGSDHPPVYIGVGGADPHDQFAGFTVKVDPNTTDGTVELHDASGQVVAKLQVKL